jgi:hypothetical protein
MFLGYPPISVDHVTAVTLAQHKDGPQPHEPSPSGLMEPGLCSTKTAIGNRHGGAVGGEGDGERCKRILLENDSARAVFRPAVPLRRDAMR